MPSPSAVRRSRLLFVLFAALAPVTAVHAAETPLPAAAQGGRATIEPARRQAWAAELRDLRQREQADLAQRWQAARAATPGDGQAEAMRALEEAKRDWRRRVLATQLRYAREAGSLETAQRIELRMARLDSLSARHAPGAAAPGGASR